MSFFALLIVALGGCFAIVWLIHYIPLHTKILGKSVSPRLAFCKMLAPLDAALTLFLICGAWIGISTAMLGISMIIYNVLTGIGISLGVVFTKKKMVPRWEEQYRNMIRAQAEVKL